MIVKCVEELHVYQKALAAATAVSAMTECGTFHQDYELRCQLRSSSAGVLAHIAEGFAQKTDRHFAHFLYIARGTANEIRAHVTIANVRHCVSESQRNDICARYSEIGKMLTGLIRHLQREDRKQRG